MVLLDMAQTWIALAKQADRRTKALRVIYETPPKAEKSA
jgi:hypothetical protein